MEAKFLKIPLTLNNEDNEYGGRESGPLILSVIKDTSSMLIKDRDSVKRLDLAIYISFTEEFPSMQSHDFRFDLSDK